jgi:hypothetical protein
MSTQKWECVTWEWLEREIVDYVLIAGERQQKPRAGSLASLLAQHNKPPTSSATPRSHTQEHSHA